MTMTIMSAAAAVTALEDPDMETLAKAISSGSLRGARGNSGVILSQLLRGFTKSVRKSKELDAIAIAAAMERAEELAVSYSYVRPNGQRDFTVLAENGISDVSIGENYMAGCSTPDAAMDQWMATDFTRERILNADATTVSVGYYEGGVYNNYWVLIFSYPENSHTEDYRQEVLDLVNVQRAKYGLTALEMGDDDLTAAAQTRAEEIAVVNSHVRPDGSKCFTVLKDYGVTDTPTGENAAWGSVSPEEVVNAWMNSEGHRANILNPEARKMSVGYYYNSNSTWGHQWIQIFTK